MNHFIYSMKSADPAPASGGDMKSWFDYYKWDVGGRAYVPVKEELLVDYEFGTFEIIWFVMDGVLLGCCNIDAVMPALNGTVELHYDTRRMQVAPPTPRTSDLKWETGRAGDSDFMDVLKRSFDAQYPPRNHAEAEGLPQATV